MQTRYAWLAGIIDGEGCLSIYRRTMRSGGRQGAMIVSTQANITITNSCAALLDECRTLLDGLGVKYTYTEPRNSTHRPLRRITVRNYGSVIALLDIVEPYMVGKRAQAALMREFATRAAARKGFKATEERLGYCARMSALNKTGELIP